ncbi:MAG: ROK family protein [Acidimicrobiia bacterium]
MDSIGIDIGGTFVKGVGAGPDGVIKARDSMRRPTNPEEMLDAVSALARSLMGSARLAVGVGIAGLVRWPDGVFVWGPHVQGVDLPIRSRLEQDLGVAVVVDNDANCAALAEANLGAATGISDALVLTLGTGIGSGIIARGEIYRGGSFAGEAGHMMMAQEGEPCPCGRRGCWETLVSGRRLDRDAVALVRSMPTGILAGISGTATPTARHLTEAAGAGDYSAKAAIADAGRWLGRGLANLVALLDPELIVIGGAVSGAGNYLLGPARLEMGRVLEGAAYRNPVPIELATTGPLAGALGASLLARAT